MQSALRAALEKQSEWITAVRWVSPAEFVFSIILLVSALVVCLMLIGINLLLAFITPVALALILMAVCYYTPRRFSTVIVNVLMLGAISLAAIIAMDQKLGVMICWGYILAAIPSLLMVVVGISRNVSALDKVSQYEAQDDFKWLLTEAPLALRLRIQMELKTISTK